MARSYRWILKPPNATGEQLANFRRALQEAVNRQSDAAERCAGILKLDPAIEEHPEGFRIFHEPAAPFLAVPPTEAWSAEAVTGFAVEVASTLEAADSLGHGGLCGHAFLRAPDGQLKITDFGIVAAFEAGVGDACFRNLAVHCPAAPDSDDPDDLVTVCWELLTPAARNRPDRFAAYVPPERWTHTEASAEAADQYALGVVLYELATGKHPYEHTGADRAVSESFEFIFAASPRAVARYRPDWATRGELAAALVQSVASAPGARFRGWGDVVRAFRAIANPGASKSDVRVVLENAGRVPIDVIVECFRRQKLVAEERHLLLAGPGSSLQLGPYDADRISLQGAYRRPNRTDFQQFKVEAGDTSTLRYTFADLGAGPQRRWVYAASAAALIAVVSGLALLWPSKRPPPRPDVAVLRQWLSTIVARFNAASDHARAAQWEDFAESVALPGARRREWRRWYSRVLDERASIQCEFIPSADLDTAVRALADSNSTSSSLPMSIPVNFVIRRESDSGPSDAQTTLTVLWKNGRWVFADPEQWLIPFGEVRRNENANTPPPPPPPQNQNASAPVVPPEDPALARLIESVAALESRIAQPAHNQLASLQTELAALEQEFRRLHEQLSNAPGQSRISESRLDERLATVRATLTSYRDALAAFESAREDADNDVATMISHAVAARDAWKTAYAASLVDRLTQVNALVTIAELKRYEADWFGVRYFLDQADQQAEVAGLADDLRRALARMRTDLIAARALGFKTAVNDAQAWLPSAGSPSPSLSARAPSAAKARELLNRFEYPAPSGLTTKPEDDAIIALLQWTTLTLEVPAAGGPADSASIGLTYIPDARDQLIDAIWLSQTEITVDQYRAVTGRLPAEDSSWEWYESMSANGANPVAYLRASAAEDFCAQLRKRLPVSLIVRLPRKSEWIHALGAGYGADRAALLRVHPVLRAYDAEGNVQLDAARVNFASDDRDAQGRSVALLTVGHRDGFAAYASVRSFPPSRWSLHDMLGNVAEWVRSDQGGGHVALGGSFRTLLAGESLDSKRVIDFEIAPGESVAREDIGFRIVVQPPP